MIDEVRALVFDVFGTVVDWREGIARDAAAFLKRHGREDIHPRAFADAWRRRYQPAMEECRSGRRPFTRLDVLHRENLEKVLGDYGIDPAAIAAAELDDLNRAWHRLDPWPDVLEGLTRLKRTRIIAPCSNGNIALMVNLAKRAGLPWDCILGAETARAYKPMPEAYLASCRQLALPPAAVMMVAAHNADLRAAKAQGLATAFVARPTEHGPGQTSDLAADRQCVDLDASSFVELASKLHA